MSTLGTGGVDPDAGSELGRALPRRPLDFDLTPCSSKATAIGFHGQGFLKVSFMRTLRVSDNDAVSHLPPGFGPFPLHRVCDYPESFSSSEEGYFMPMHQREAMFIEFKSSRPFAVKVFVGGANAITGASLRQPLSKVMEALKEEFRKKGRGVQNYVVAGPDQRPWLDGIAHADGAVRQFVAMPLGSGYSVAAQGFGGEVAGGSIRIEATPRHVSLPQRVRDAPPLQLFFELRGDKQIAMSARPGSTVHELQCRIAEREFIPVEDQRLVWGGRHLVEEMTLYDYKVPNEATIHVISRVRGGGKESPPPPKEVLADEEKMSIAAGGRIKQSIGHDGVVATVWDTSRATAVDVHIVNPAAFKRITGIDPPATPITAKSYAEEGYPYFDVYGEEPTGIRGIFGYIKSVKQIDKKSARTEATEAAIKEVEESMATPVVMLDHRDEWRPLRRERLPFRHVKDLESPTEEVEKNQEF